MTKKEAKRIKAGDVIRGKPSRLYLEPTLVTGIVRQSDDPLVAVPLFQCKEHPDGITYVALEPVSHTDEPE